MTPEGIRYHQRRNRAARESRQRGQRGQRGVGAEHQGITISAEKHKGRIVARVESPPEERRWRMALARCLMKLDSPVSFERRYDLRHQLWLDGPHRGWLALDRSLGREVVVNLPYRPDDDAWFLQMAQIRTRLRHANLIPLYALGTTKDGNPFFTEPYIEAMDIRKLQRDEYVKSANATLPRLVSYFLDACKAVAFLHANAFLHLELHVGNILVGPASQEVFLIRGHPSLPPVSIDRGNRMCGVPGYMAPEQVDPQRLGAPDALTDVYGLGGILFEILYGIPSNGRRSATLNELLQHITARKGPPLRGTFGIRAAQCPNFARKLETVCLRALVYERTARQASVSALINEVEHCAWGMTQLTSR